MLALYYNGVLFLFFFFFQAEDGIRDKLVTGVQTCALPICLREAALCQGTFGQLADEATDMSEVELLSGPHASRFTNTDIRTRQLLGHSFLKEQPPMPRSSKPARCFCLSRKFHAASKSR